MERNKFKERMKQYKKAREENPGLKYWEFLRNNIDENGNVVSTKESPLYTLEHRKELKRREHANEIIKTVKSRQQKFDQERDATDLSGAIPFFSEKAVTLTNAGKDTGVTLSTNVLDSIAKYANIADLSLLSALGLAGQESTFGKGYGVEAKEILPSILVSDWNYNNGPSGLTDRSENPYVGLMQAANLKVNGYHGDYILDDNNLLEFVYDQKYIDALEGGIPFADKEAKRLRTDVPVLEHAFKKYKSGKYNPNDPRHIQMVEDRGKALINSPEIQKWMKESEFVPKYGDGIGNVEEWDPRITAEGYDDKGYYAQAMNPLPEVTVVGSKTRSRSERPILLTYVKGLPGTATWTTDYNPGAGVLEIVSPEFELLSGGIGLPRQLYNNRIASLAKELISNESEKTLSKISSKIKSHIPNTSFIGETFNVPLSKTQLLVEMYKRNISKETQDVLNLLGKERTLSNFKLRLNPLERDFLRKHNVDESILTDRDIRKLKELRQLSISEALEKGQRVVTSPIKAEGGSLVLQKNTENGLSVIGKVNYGSNPYDYMRYLGRELKPINNMDLTDDDMVIGWIQGSLGEKGVSKDLYNGLAHWLNLTSPGSGFISGMKLMSPEPTTKTLDKLNKILISNLGEYLWATGITTDNPIYKIINPTGEYPAVKSLMFDPKAIKNGKIITDLDNPDIYFADGGEVTGPPTYEDWLKSLIKNNLWMHPDYYMSHSLNTATKALKLASAKLPGREDMPPVPVPAEIKGEFPQEWVMNNLYNVENPRKKGVTKKYAKMYDSRTLGAGVDVVSGHPELYDKAKRFGIEKELADEIAYEHIVHDDQVIRDNYADIYGKAAADTLSFGPRFLVAQARYQLGNVRKGWDEIHKALAKGDAKALKKAVLKVTPEDHDYRKKWVKNFNVYGNEPE